MAKNAITLVKVLIKPIKPYAIMVTVLKCLVLNIASPKLASKTEQLRPSRLPSRPVFAEVGYGKKKTGRFGKNRR